MFLRIYIWTVRIILIFSLSFSVYAAFQMISTKAEINQALLSYQQSEPGKAENPITDMQSDEKHILPAASGKTESPLFTEPLYKDYPIKGEVFGQIEFPSLNQVFPIIHGTDQQELAKGVGHFAGSVLPGEKDNTVLAGHRDTVFQNIGSLKMGDEVYIETVAGKFHYQIISQRIVEANDRSVIVPSEEATLTLVTCYPFDFIGPAPQRYILTGSLK